MKSKFNISVANEQNLFEIDETKINKYCQSMMKNALTKIELPNEIIKAKNINFDVVFCDNKTIREINKEYRDKDKPTDVITFSLFFDDENKIIINNQIHLGEIIISSEKTNTQAKENNKTFNQELMFLLSHGILHLLGLDHPTDKELELMLDLQEEMIKEVINDQV